MAQTLRQHRLALHIKQLILERRASGINNQNFHNAFTSDAYLWEQYVSTLYSLVILVDLHVEGLDILWIVRHNNWLTKMLLYQVALVLRCKIFAP